MGGGVVIFFNFDENFYKNMTEHSKKVCPLWMAGVLDSKLRKIFHRPRKILKPYIKKNMVALDIGCGPGVFSIEIAKLLEVSGKVIAVDMQQGMLDIIKRKIKGTSIEKIIELRKCTQETVGLKENVDFALMFYVVHEVPSKENLFDEVLPLINKDGLLMIAEPKVISEKSFNEMVNIIKERGFEEYDKPKIPFSRGIVLKKI